MKLYVIPGACSLAANISLREASVSFDVVCVDASTGSAADGVRFTDVNPKGYVPALCLEDGQVLTETVAILMYIADRHPAARLEPQGPPMQRYRLLEWLCFINSEIHKAFSPLFISSAPHQIKKYAHDHLAKRFDWLDKAVGSADFLMPQHFTVADAYLFTVLSWTAEVEIDLSRWPSLKRYHAQSGSRPAVAAALRSEGLWP